jgi:uncharacterized protein YcbK (DUF882 family)
MLSVKKRQQYLKDAKYYKGEIDGKMSSIRKAILAMKKDYSDVMSKKESSSSLYTQSFNKLLVNDNRVRRDTENFSLKGDKKLLCQCGGKYCNGAPTLLDEQLLKNLQTLRNKYGPITITCGLRCKKYNASLVGSVPNSGHTKGKALDIYIPGACDTEFGRKKIMEEWMKLPNYKYTYANIANTHPNMGNAIHIEVK